MIDITKSMSSSDNGKKRDRDSKNFRSKEMNGVGDNGPY